MTALADLGVDEREREVLELTDEELVRRAYGAVLELHIRDVRDLSDPVGELEAVREAFERRAVMPSPDHWSDGEARSLGWIVGQLWNCTDVMPSEICDALELPAGSTYAAGVRSVAAGSDA